MKRFIKWISSFTLPEFYEGQEWKFKKRYLNLKEDIILIREKDHLLRITKTSRFLVYAVNIYGEEKSWGKKLIRKRYNKIR